MIWTPSPRPPWSEWLMNLTLREATAFMAHLSPVAPPLALSSRRRRALTSRAKPLCFEVYLIEGGQPTNADGQIIVSTGGFFFTGTEGSNPSPSSGESAANLTSSIRSQSRSVVSLAGDRGLVEPVFEFGEVAAHMRA